MSANSYLSTVREMAEAALRDANTHCGERLPTPGPWQVTVDYSEEMGGTVLGINQHVEPSIALGPECWPDDDEGDRIEDGYGYRQPDGRENTPSHKIANARWIATARSREPALAAFALKALAVVNIVEKYRDPCREHSCPYHGEMNAALKALTADAEPKEPQ